MCIVRPSRQINSTFERQSKAHKITICQNAVCALSKIRKIDAVYFLTFLNAQLNSIGLCMSIYRYS